MVTAAKRLLADTGTRGKRGDGHDATLPTRPSNRVPLRSPSQFFIGEGSGVRTYWRIQESVAGRTAGAGLRNLPPSRGLAAGKNRIRYREALPGDRRPPGTTRRAPEPGGDGYYSYQRKSVGVSAQGVSLGPSGRSVRGTGDAAVARTVLRPGDFLCLAGI